MARAFALSPRLLLADEAFSRLDEVTACQLRCDFLESARRQGTTVVLITHQLEEAIEMGERILVFGKPGRLVMDVRPGEFLQQGTAGELRERLQEAIGVAGTNGAVS